MAGKIYKNSFILNSAWGDGRRSAETEQSIETNPYESDDPAYQAWIDGFNNIFA